MSLIVTQGEAVGYCRTQGSSCTRPGVVTRFPASCRVVHSRGGDCAIKGCGPLTRGKRLPGGRTPSLTTASLQAGRPSGASWESNFSDRFSSLQILPLQRNQRRGGVEKTSTTVGAGGRIMKGVANAGAVLSWDASILHPRRCALSFATEHTERAELKGSAEGLSARREENFRQISRLSVPSAAGMNWRRGWDSNPDRSLLLRKMQILHCQAYHSCHLRRRPLHATGLPSRTIRTHFFSYCPYSFR